MTRFFAFARPILDSLEKGFLRFARGEGSEGRNGGFWPLLIPLGWLGSVYGNFRNLSYEKGWLAVRRPKIPVISVGNLTLGGTSKTPCVAWLVQALSRELPQAQVGVISRGYTGTGTPTVFRGGQSTRAQVGDEPLLLSHQLPQTWVAVGKDRLAGAERLSQCEVDVAIADDAFQHRRLERAFDLVLIDAEVPFGNGRVLPAGWLREPIEGLARADAILLTRCEKMSRSSLDGLTQWLSRLADRARIFEGRLEVFDWLQIRVGQSPTSFERESSFSGVESGYGFSAIARPGSFFSTIESESRVLVGQETFRDHHLFSLEEVQSVERQAENLQAGWLTCTEKDLYNLPQDWKPRLPVFIPRVRLRVSQGDALISLIRERLASVL